MMRRAVASTIGFCLVAGCVHGDSTANPVAGAPRPSVPAAARVHARPVRPTGAGAAVALARVGDTEIAYFADPDDGQIVAADAESLTELSSLDVGGSPNQLLLTKQGRLFATLRDENILVAIEGTGTRGDPLHVVRYAPTASEPIGLAETPDESWVLVTSGWGHTLASYATDTLARGFTKDLGREPRGVIVSDDGKRAFVSHAVGGDVDLIDLANMDGGKRVSMTSGGSLAGASGRSGATSGEVSMNAGQGFALARAVSPAGRVFVPHARIRTARVDDTGMQGYGSPEAGPTEQFDVAVLDEDTGAALPGSLDTDGGLACVLPRAATVTETGELLVACLGTGEIVGMDAAAANPHQAVTQRWHVPAGPMGIAVDDARPRALVWSQFDHALTWILLQGRDAFVLNWSKLPRRSPLPALVDRGRVLFHLSDARISLDGRACASCHPDGRDDGLVWSTPDGPRNPPMLAGRLDSTEPYGWLGSSRDVSSHLKLTFARLGATGGKRGLTAEDKKALVAYVMSMEPPAVVRDQALDLRVGEGKRIFDSHEAGCADCHGRSGGSPDGQTHNVRSWATGDRIGIFDTPSLRFVGGTAPYFHDGRYASLRSLLTHTRGAMGQDKKLSSSELDALEAYVRTL